MYKRPSKQIRVGINIVRASLLVVMTLLLSGLPSTGEVGAMSADEGEAPFILPFAGSPGPDTWLLAQPYGNTTFAYRYRSSVYWAGQGLHFGLDLAAPCGTSVLAIGDGIVYSVDSWHGAKPHNLLINHSNGYASFYGHLLVRSHLKAGQKVNAGDVIGLSGDPDLTCASRPHLHLEIRDAPNHTRAFNPMPLIDADWERIALIGGHPITFEQNINHPRRWQELLDQPNVRFGSPLVNDYENPWPPDW